MISIKSNEEITLMRKAGEILTSTRKYLEGYIKEGITTKELDSLAYDYIISKDAYPSFKGFNGYPASICTSLNEVVVHGIPSDTALKDGDIIAIDLGVCYKGYHADSAWTYKIGNISLEKEMLLKGTKESLYAGLNIVKEGIRLSDISREIENVAKKYNLGIVKELVGHGIGNKLHEDPDIPNYVTKDKGPILKSGMTLAIEPMLTLKSPRVVMDDDNWGISTLDKSPSAHFEHTILVTKDGYEILTGE